MKQITIFYEVLGRKVKTTVWALDEKDAQIKIHQKIRESTIFYQPKTQSQETKSPLKQDPMKDFEDIFNLFFGKKK